MRVQRRPAPIMKSRSQATGMRDADEDIYGIPNHVYRPATLRSHWRRHKWNGLLILAFLAFLYWYSTREVSNDHTDWSAFAYVQYATDAHSLCNSFLVFEALHRLGSKPQRVLLYPREWKLDSHQRNDRVAELLVRAKKFYGVRLKPVQLLGVDGPIEPGTWDEGPAGWDASITKLRAFELDEYERVLHLDSDITLQHHLDDLFHLPPVPMALTRAYWYNYESSAPAPLSSLMMLLQPNAAETKHLYHLLELWRHDPNLSNTATKYDMELINERFGASAMILPHRPYTLLTSEFRRGADDHGAYLGTTNAPPSTPGWDAFRVLREAHIIHFSDWPLPKPWIGWSKESLEEIQPGCAGAGTCAEREVWKGLYEDFRARRKEFCRLLPGVPPADWQEWKNRTGAA